ncbi:hypothetical protein [Intrasporangium sp.]|uniref:hypothetical protein n=1 Tax=Intrasporangium sp. TaxID=1925024 RepID=UPI00293A376D|nr:hypothetical protein [Intrasporangium sp.]MDV3221586.1 hypothetical protein [Intrasporangium sp.]
MTDTRDAASGAPPGSVAHEAALLVDLLSSRGWGGQAGQAGERSEPAGPDPTSGRDECTCGGTTPAACRLCPVCQLIALVQKVSPEALEQVAEVIDLAATALRDLAQAQRDRKAGGAGSSTPTADTEHP